MKMKDLIEDKLLDLNLDNCSFLIAGKKKARIKIEMEREPLILCNTVIKQVNESKYLGCHLAGTVSESASRRDSVGSSLCLFVRADLN